MARIVLERMWFNQPSILQPDHKQHGTRVLAPPEPDNPETMVSAYFLDGPVHSIRTSRLSLSEGWPEHTVARSYVGPMAG